jgi:outer membrane protein assembly factor BamB
MKTLHYYLLITLAILGGLLTACSGAAGAATNWPAVLADSSQETAYVAYNTHVYAVNLTNGTEKWRYPEKADSKITFFAPPAMTQDGQLLVASYDHKLYSLNPGGSTTPNWVFKGALDRYIAGPLASGEDIFAPASDNFLYALDLSGNQRWKVETGHALWARPTTDGKLVFQPSMDHHLYAIDIQSGKTAWETGDLGGAMVGSPTLSPNGVLYVGTFKAEVLALDASNGQMLWSAPTKGWVWSEILLDGDTLYFGDLDGYLFALNAADGAVRWQVQLDTSANRAISGAPVIVGDTLYVAAKNGNLYAVDVANGNVRWSKAFAGQFYSDIIQAGDNLLLAPIKMDAILLAVDNNGNQKWAFVPAK